MAYKFLVLSGLLLNLISCHNTPKESNHSKQHESFSDETVRVADTDRSFISFTSIAPSNIGQDVNISNTIYSLESFKFDATLQDFICKASIEETIGFKRMHINRSEKIEFYDYNFHKQFEIGAENREIELKDDYFITRGLFTDIPRSFELNNYETNRAFVKCRGLCWVAEIPNSETIAYFGYQPGGVRNDTGLQHLGTLYYGLNGNLKSELRFYFHPLQRYHGLTSFSLVSKIEEDKITYSNSEIRKLILWSKNGNTGQEFISDFTIKVKLKREKTHKMNEYEDVIYTLTVNEGKLKGKDLEPTTYGYQLILK